MKPYLKYIFEVLAIVVGISLSFMVDEWKKKNEEQKIEISYISRLKSDLNFDIDQFNGFMDSVLFNKKMVLESFLKIDSLNNEEYRKVFPTYNNLDYSTYEAIPLSQMVTYQEMENNGFLRLIDDIELRKSLNKYYKGHSQMVDILAKPIGNYKRLFADSYLGYLYSKFIANVNDISEDQINRGIQELLQSKDFISSLNSEMYYTADQIYWMRNAVRQCERLVELIDNYTATHY